jgi:3'-phosphoadenosine 5'-phosphosulfate sulfotransferase (PAPS reductase)/FAD synthetase
MMTKRDLEAYLEQRHKTLIEECSKAERPIALAVPNTFPAYAVNGSYCLGLPLRRAAITEPAFIWRNQETEKLSRTRLRHLDPRPARRMMTA